MPAGVTTDIAGTPNSGVSYTYNYLPKSPKYTTVSNTLNGVYGGTLAAVAVTPIVVGSLATGNLPPTSRSHQQFSTLLLLSTGQKAGCRGLCSFGSVEYASKLHFIAEVLASWHERLLQLPHCNTANTDRIDCAISPARCCVVPYLLQESSNMHKVSHI